MSDQTPTCRECGADLTGRDVYEGICKACRAELVLAGATAKKKREPRKAAEPQPQDQESRPSPDVIALETEVDVDADTRAMAEKQGPKAEPLAAHSEDEAEESFGSLGALEMPGEPPAEPKAARTPQLAETKDPEVIPFDLDRKQASPNPEDRGEKAPEQELPADLLPSDELVLVGDDDLLPAQPPAQAQEARGASRAEVGAASDAADDFVIPLTAMGDDEEMAQRPPKREPTPAPKDDLPVLALADGERKEAAKQQPPDQAEAQAVAAPAPEESSGAEVLALRTAPVAAEPKPAEPQATQEAENGTLRLRGERPDRKTLALAAELSAQIEELKDVVGKLSKAQVRPLGFGFKAFFGVVLGLGVLLVVTAGLTALVGLLFHPPALEFLKRLLDAVTGG